MIFDRYSPIKSIMICSIYSIRALFFRIINDETRITCKRKDNTNLLISPTQIYNYPNPNVDTYYPDPFHQF
jgi:hypothetical protein